MKNKNCRVRRKVSCIQSYFPAFGSHVTPVYGIYIIIIPILPLYCEKAIIAPTIVEIVVRIQTATRKTRNLDISFEVKPGIL
jgi:hypothetical protein